ncbi:MAG TPA: nuclear transport factor 2 family protein [Cyclobacteriaceae bacterium]|nr:nuclear transport factor 2 family protein [Cyclobacteriaceae bacterium]
MQPERTPHNNLAAAYTKTHYDHMLANNFSVSLNRINFINDFRRPHRNSVFLNQRLLLILMTPEFNLMTDKEVILAEITKFIESYNTQDLDSLADCYSDSLIKFRNNSAPETKSEVLNRIAHLWTSKSATLNVTVDELIVDQNLAVASGTLMLTIASIGSQQRHTEMRRYMEVWRRENDKWMVFRTMDNQPNS